LNDTVQAITSPTSASPSAAQAHDAAVSTVAGRTGIVGIDFALTGWPGALLVTVAVICGGVVSWAGRAAARAKMSKGRMWYFSRSSRIKYVA
jgi:hypothetical protein